MMFVRHMRRICKVPERLGRCWLDQGCDLERSIVTCLRLTLFFHATASMSSLSRHTERRGKRKAYGNSWSTKNSIDSAAELVIWIFHGFKIDFKTPARSEMTAEIIWFSYS